MTWAVGGASPANLTEHALKGIMMNAPHDPSFSEVNSGSTSNAVQQYTVAAGDSLSKIAKRFYGDAKLWHLIHEANSDLVKNPDLIQVGWTLMIPPKP